MSETTSNVLFAILLCVVAARMIWQLVTESRSPQSTR
jgi:hypothetical protein